MTANKSLHKVKRNTKASLVKILGVLLTKKDTWNNYVHFFENKIDKNICIVSQGNVQKNSIAISVLEILYGQVPIELY